MAQRSEPRHISKGIAQMAREVKAEARQLRETAKRLGTLSEDATKLAEQYEGVADALDPKP